MSLADKVTQFSNDADLAHQIVHGDANTTVATDGGPVKSFAKLQSDYISPMATQVSLLAANTAAQNATAFGASVFQSGSYSVPASGSYALQSVDMPADATLVGNNRTVLLTTPAAGKPWAIRFPQAMNNQALERIKLAPGAGAAAHDGVVSELMNGAVLQQPNITGYAGAAAIRYKDATAMRVNGGQFGNGCDVAVSLQGATNDSVFTAATIAYPKYCGYYFGPGGQANTLIGGETAVQDGGVPIIIDRNNSVTVAGHNTESQATGGTPAAFYVIGCGPGMVSQVTGNPGAGYTDGTYYLTATGGNGSPPRVQAVIVGGAVTARNMVFPGFSITVPWTLTLPPAAGAGAGATFVSTLGTTTATHNTQLRNENVIANKGNVADVVSVQSPVFGMLVDGIKVNATKITNSIVKYLTTNANARIRDVNVSSKAAGVCDVEVAAEAGFFSGGRYNIGTTWEFLLNKGLKFLLAGTQARSNFPTAGRAAVIDMDVATDALVAPLAMRSRNGDPHATTFDPTFVAAGALPALYNNAVAGGRITAPAAKKLKYTSEFTTVLFVRVAALGGGFCGFAQRQGSWVLRGSANNAVMPQAPQAQVTIGGVTYSITAAATLAANTWAMLAIRRNNTEGRLYVHVNDQSSFVAAVPTTALDGSTGNHLFFNRDGSANASYTGDLAGARVYDRALTLGELRFIYESKSAALGMAAWGTADVAADPGTANLQLRLDPATFAAGNAPMVPDSSPNGYQAFFGASKGPLTTTSLDAKNGQIQQGNGSDLEGNAWRDFGILDDDPATLANGDTWVRGDLAPPERRYRVAGATYKLAMTLAP